MSFCQSASVFVCLHIQVIGNSMAMFACQCWILSTVSPELITGSFCWGFSLKKRGVSKWKKSEKHTLTLFQDGQQSKVFKWCFRILIRLAHSNKWPAAGISVWAINAIAVFHYTTLFSHPFHTMFDPKLVTKISLTNSNIITQKKLTNVLLWFGTSL